MQDFFQQYGLSKPFAGGQLGAIIHGAILLLHHGSMEDGQNSDYGVFFMSVKGI